MVARCRTTMPMAVNTAPARAAATTRACSSKVIPFGRFEVCVPSITVMLRPPHCRRVRACQRTGTTTGVPP